MTKKGKKPREGKYRLAVRRSSAGLGLFADESIPRGAFIIEYFGPILSQEEADEKGGRYLFEVSDDVVIDGSSETIWHGILTTLVSRTVRPILCADVCTSLRFGRCGKVKN